MPISYHVTGIFGSDANIYSAWSEWNVVEGQKEIYATKRSNGEQVTLTCGRNQRFRLEIKKQTERTPCPTWSSWSYKYTDRSKNSLCWNEDTNKQHFCHTDSHLRQRSHPSQIGTRTKFRDCQGKFGKGVYDTEIFVFKDNVSLNGFEFQILF